MSPMPFLCAAVLLAATAGCSTGGDGPLFKGDAMCQRTAGSEGGCTAVPSSDAYREEKERIRENKKVE
jgi:hypothetical protein